MRWTLPGVALIGATVIAWYIFDAKSQRELAAARAAFAVHGFPTRLEEIIPAPVPEDQNADALLHRARQTMTGSTDREKNAPAPVFRKLDEIELTQANSAAVTPAFTGGPPEFSAEQLEAAAVLLGDPMVTKCLEQLHQAMALPTWRPHPEYEKGYAQLFPHVVPLRSFVQLLAKRAAVMGRFPEGVDAAWNDLIAAWTLADWADVEPSMISFRAGEIARGTIEPHALALLSSGQTPAQLDRIVERRKQTIAALPARFARAVQAERLGGLDAVARDLESRRNWIAQVRELSGVSTRLHWLNPWLDPILSRVGRPRLRNELATCYEFHFRAEIAVVARDRHMASRLEAISDEIDRSTSILANIIFPSLRGFATGYVIHVTRQRALLALSVSLLHHRDTGTWPATIEELGLPAALTNDACSDQQLVLLAEDGWLLVYGFGFDGDDDRGRALPPAHMHDGDGDIALRVRIHE